MKRRFFCIICPIIISSTIINAVNFDANYMWEQCSAIIINGNKYTIPREVLVEILLQAGANPSKPDANGILPIQHPVSKYEPKLDVVGNVVGIESSSDFHTESAISVILVKYGAKIPKGLCRQKVALEWLDRTEYNTHEDPEYQKRLNPIKEWVFRTLLSGEKNGEKIVSLDEGEIKRLTELLHHVLKMDVKEVSLETLPDLFKIFLEGAKTKINEVDSKGLGLLHWARIYGRTKLAALLESCGAKDF